MPRPKPPAPPVFPELDPLELLYRLNWDRWHFAAALGIEKGTVDKWAARVQTPPRTARRLAAELAKQYL